MGGVSEGYDMQKLAAVGKRNSAELLGEVYPLLIHLSYSLIRFFNFFVTVLY